MTISTVFLITAAFQFAVNRIGHEQQIVNDSGEDYHLFQELVRNFKQFPLAINQSLNFVVLCGFMKSFRDNLKLALNLKNKDVVHTMRTKAAVGEKH